MWRALALVIALTGVAHAERRVSVAFDGSLAVGTNTVTPAQIFPYAAAFGGMRFVLEQEPPRAALRTCWMKPAPDPDFETVQARCRTARFSFAPQASIERVISDHAGVRAMAGVKLQVAIHELVPRDTLGRISLGVRGGVFRTQGQTPDTFPSWDVAFGADVGEDITFGAEAAVTAWHEPIDMQSSTTYFLRVGVQVGARL